MKGYGWFTRTDGGYNLIGLDYAGSGPDIFLSTGAISHIARFSGDGYVYLENQTYNLYWAYIIKNNRADRHSLTKKIIDFQSKKELNDLLDEVVSSLLDLGTTKTELEKIIKKRFIKKLFD